MFDYESRPLINYVPDVLKDVLEYQALMFALQLEISNLFRGIENALDDQFVVSATEYGVKRWEKILKISPKATFTLDERKFTILGRLSEQLPFTYRMLVKMLTQLCGENAFEALIVGYDLSVKLELKVKNNFEDVEKLLARVVPANMVITVTIRYNQQDVLGQKTHRQLHEFTHYQLRNEVI
jgi:hypothetical protein